MPLALSGPVDSLPEVGLVPDQLPEAVQVPTLFADQLSVEDAPLSTEVGLAMSDTAGDLERDLRPPRPQPAIFADPSVVADVSDSPA